MPKMILKLSSIIGKLYYAFKEQLPLNKTESDMNVTLKMVPCKEKDEIKDI